MRKRLLVLDLVLAATVAVLGFRLRDAWLEARKREAVVLGQPLKPLPPPPYAPLRAVPQLNGAGFAEVAQKNLFSADRNPTVVVEVPPPPVMPALPVAYGVIDLGDGPTAILSVKSGAPHQEYRAGAKVGDFMLLALSSEEIVLEWQGKQIVKKIEDLMDRTAVAAAPAGEAGGAPPPRPSAATVTSTTTPGGPGNDMGGGLRACQPGDTAPPGTVSGGLKKVVSESPFGKICRWEPVK